MQKLRNFAQRDVEWRRRVLIVDDEPLFAALVAEALEGKGYSAETAQDARTAIRLVDEFDPDFAIIDIHLGEGPTGIDLGRRLDATHPQIGIMFLSRYSIGAQLESMFGDLPRSAILVDKGDLKSADALTSQLYRLIGNSSTLDQKPRLAGIAALSKTQLEVLRLAAQGYNNEAIAKFRGTNLRTVEQRMQSVYVKLGIDVNGQKNPRVEAIRQYIKVAGLPTATERDLNEET